MNKGLEASVPCTTILFRKWNKERDQVEKLVDKNHQRKEQIIVHLRPSLFMSVKINPNYAVYLYLYLIDKGAPLPSYPVRTNSVPSSYQIRVPISGDRFIGKVMNLN